MSLRGDMIAIHRRIELLRKAMRPAVREFTNKVFDQWLAQQNLNPGDLPMTRTNTFTVEVTPDEPGLVGQITLKVDARLLDASLYDDWMLAATRLHNLPHPVIPDGNFATWYLWSLQCDRDPITLAKAQSVWDALSASPIDLDLDPRQPVLAKTTGNAVALILDKYTDVAEQGLCDAGALVITDVAELQRELINLVDAAKG